MLKIEISAQSAAELQQHVRELSAVMSGQQMPVQPVVTQQVVTQPAAVSTAKAPEEKKKGPGRPPKKAEEKKQEYATPLPQPAVAQAAQQEPTVTSQAVPPPTDTVKYPTNEEAVDALKKLVEKHGNKTGIELGKMCLMRVGRARVQEIPPEARKMFIDYCAEALEKGESFQ